MSSGHQYLSKDTKKIRQKLLNKKSKFIWENHPEHKYSVLFLRVGTKLSGYKFEIYQTKPTDNWKKSKFSNFKEENRCLKAL